uniref:AAA domain-containing protein n=1 Tax=Gracilinema caldarium TaxID=215591 RepID=A0A7C3HYE1_9SPIR
MGECLKLLVDLFPNKYFIISGSSAFTISQSASEPLTGRSNPRVLYPLAIVELVQKFLLMKLPELQDYLKTRLNDI